MKPRNDNSLKRTTRLGLMLSVCGSLSLAAPTVVTVASSGCAKRSTAATSTSTASEAKLAELRLARRRDRRRMRHLEEKMAKLAGDSHRIAEVAKLPVERVAPPRPQGEQADEVVSIADDGTEIVYVGEAAQPQSVKAETSLLQKDRAARERRVVARSTAPPKRSVPAVISSGSIPRVHTSTHSHSGARPRGGTLGVTRSRLPSVGEVATSAPTRSSDSTGSVTTHPTSRAREAGVTLRGRRPRTASVPTTALADYQANVAALRGGKHDQAIDGFRRFVRRYPRSDYSDNAQYWLGEAFYDRKLFKQALTEFAAVGVTYPQGNKVPDAELKAAYCKLALGDKDGGIAHLRGLIKRFAGTRPAELAAQKLERLAK